VDSEIAEVAKAFGPGTAIGRRRTRFADAPHEDLASLVEEALTPREPITVVLSQMGWIRALKGHTDDLSGIKHKDGDSTAFFTKAETTDKLVLFTTDGRFYTLDASKLPGGRGFGEPLRLHLDIDENAAPVSLRKHDPERRLLVAVTASSWLKRTCWRASARASRCSTSWTGPRPSQRWRRRATGSR
jgi:topoisomerase IV subunit A